MLVFAVTYTIVFRKIFDVFLIAENLIALYIIHFIYMNIVRNLRKVIMFI